jgi:DnaJ-class molecular chaperone
MTTNSNSNSDGEPFAGECGSSELEQTTRVPCDDCQGTGLVGDAACETCIGSGTKTIRTKVSVSRCLPDDE